MTDLEVRNKTLKVTDSEFEQEVLQSKDAVLVDFWAEWCAPCRMVAPALEALADEYDGRLKVRKLNIDENILTPPRFQVRAIPTMILFKDGEPVETIIGAQTKSQLKSVVAPHLDA
ncbi:MAG: thioredoxin [Gammaproteobacteria bacterium]|nr:thioredoxin [Gammaproteobacteria bacterium]